MRLAGQVALITGAAAGVEGQLMGFGGAAARLFVRQGARVVLTDIKEEAGLQTAEQIRAHGKRSSQAPCQFGVSRILQDAPDYWRLYC
jgi:NAD(P)-dependent dehydrogenase (short-subunit alcohol dehydrogenase family)